MYEAFRITNFMQRVKKNSEFIVTYPEATALAAANAFPPPYPG